MTDTYIGLLSGTSMDAIDVAAVDFSEEKPNLISTLNVELPKEYKSQYLRIIHDKNISLEELGQLDVWTAEVFAGAVIQFLDQSKINKNDIKALGSHGQTIWHAPEAPKPFTMQIGDPNVIAHRTGITTVADFRRADVAAGGQGAPLAPLFHKYIFANSQEPRCIVNIGGLSNVSIIDGNNFLGFDTGPGNCLMDLVCKEHFNCEYDKNGEIARTGTIDQNLLNKLLQDPYFAQKPPKSTGREYFNSAWVGEIDIAPKDLLATLCMLTAQTICDEIRKISSPNSEVFLCGGGARNSYLRELMSEIIEKEVGTTEQLGIDPEWVEAGLFAWLAKMAIEKIPLDTSSITGANKPIILGTISHTL